MLEKRYPALRIISVLCKIFAVITVLGGLLTFIGASSLGGYYGGLGAMVSLPLFLSSIVLAVVFWASGESILVFLDIEENTRRMTAGYNSEVVTAQAYDTPQYDYEEVPEIEVPKKRTRAKKKVKHCEQCGMEAQENSDDFCAQCGNRVV